MIVDLVLNPAPAESQEVEFVEDLDDLSEGDKCSCKAGDDNPF
ncbi:MAG TPA: hypothetical protein VMV92_08890 [Streptosporangiaceae bacterium]|nr:hypothetical protein [Streptosporangiaceae bacterium]